MAQLLVGEQIHFLHLDILSKLLQLIFFNGVKNHGKFLVIFVVYLVISLVSSPIQY